MTTKSSGRPREGLRFWIYAATTGVGLLAAAASLMGWGDRSGDPIRLGAGDDATEGEPVAVDDEAIESPARRDGKPRTILASLSGDSESAKPTLITREQAPPSMAETIARAKREIAACLKRYESIKDYSCVFHKHERIGGHLVSPHIMTMKARTKPNSFYFKFQQPNKGREAIFIPGKHNDKIVAHEPGMLKMIAGTMNLDPVGTMAMEENRHPITEAGIGSLIHTVIDRWDVELDPAEAIVEIHPHAKVGHRPCTMIETLHPTRSPSFLFHRVKVYIDHEQGLPIRFEAYDWPKTAGASPELVEEYTYSDLKTDVGLSDLDFDPANPHYSYGRF